jgi:hypothetical protein
MFKRVLKFLMYLCLQFLFETAQMCYTVKVNFGLIGPHSFPYSYRNCFSVQVIFVSGCGNVILICDCISVLFSSHIMYWIRPWTEMPELPVFINHRKNSALCRKIGHIIQGKGLVVL